MIVTTKDCIGKWVIYTDYDMEQRIGRIKSFNNNWIFVVYHCDNNWDNYQNYTAAATRDIDLRFTNRRPE